MSISLFLPSVLLVGCGLIGLIVGAFLTMCFDISELLPPIGFVLAMLSTISMFFGIGVQLGIWTGLVRAG